MSSSTDIIVRRLPLSVIREIIDNKLLSKAIAHYDNQFMQILSKIWYKYIEPGEENMNCNICKERILNCLRGSEGNMIKEINEALLNDYKNKIK